MQFLRIINVNRKLNRTFYQLGLNLWQFVTRATDLGIDFRKFVRDDNDSDYKSTCANEETVDETGLPRTRELAYELSARRVRAGGSGLGWIWPGMAGFGLGWCLPVAPGPRAWVRRLGRVAWVRRSSPEWLLTEGEKGKRRGEEEKEERREKREEKREIRERRRREKERKDFFSSARVFGGRNPII